MQTQESDTVNDRHPTKGLRGSVLLTSGPLLLSPCSWLHRVENSEICLSSASPYLGQGWLRSPKAMTVSWWGVGSSDSEQHGASPTPSSVPIL